MRPRPHIGSQCVTQQIAEVATAADRAALSARKQLAQELGYTGALDGSVEMNVWLHRQVMTKLAESGGRVPDGLKT